MFLNLTFFDKKKGKCGAMQPFRTTDMFRFEVAVKFFFRNPGTCVAF